MRAMFIMLGLVAVLTVACLFVVNSGAWVWVLPLMYTGLGAVACGAWWLALWRTRKRLEWVRRTVLGTIEGGDTSVSVDTLALLLQDKEVHSALRYAQDLQERIWEARYARGEAADF